MSDVAVKSLKVLVDEYNAADAAVEAAKAAVEAAILVRSNACQAIAQSVAPAKRVTFNGKEHTVVVRPNKETNVDLYFFRTGKGGSVVVE